jgi:hypothetical protein
MRFLCIYKPGKLEADRLPNPDEMTAMGKLIEDMAKAGVLLTTGGCDARETPARLRVDNGKITVADGPFREIKELVGGFCLMQVKSKAEAIEWGKRFLAIVGEGQTEILPLAEMPPAAA